MLKVERIDAALYPRTWSFNRPPDQPAGQLILLTDGSCEAEAGNNRLAVEAPALAWLSVPEPGRLRADAGATGHWATVTPALVAAALGSEPESAGIAALAGRSFVLSLAGSADQAGLVERCMGAMLGEQRNPQAASAIMLSALLRIVLVAAFRVSGGAAVGEPAEGGASSVLVRFRQLVEINFRNRWPISRYAQTLGVSTDRLHSLCTRGTGKPPKLLVSERLAQEAALRLEQSTVTTQRLAHSLGFGDQAHFSNFFRRMTGMSPTAYRRMSARALRREEPRPQVSFAEWP